MALKILIVIKETNFKAVQILKFESAAALMTLFNNEGVFSWWQTHWKLLPFNPNPPLRWLDLNISAFPDTVAKCLQRQRSD